MRVGLILLVLFVAASGSAQTVLLRYRPPVGKSISYTLVNTTSTAMPGSDQSTQTSQTVPMALRVLSSANGLTTLEARTGPVSSGGSILGKEEVSRMTLDEFCVPKAAAGSDPSSAFMNSFSSALGGGSQGFVFPENAIKVGDTWTSTVDYGKLGGVTRSGAKMSGRLPMVCRLASVAGGIATIEMSSEGKIVVNSGSRNLSLDTRMHATYRIDVATGLMLSATTDTNSSVEIPGRGTLRQHLISTMR